MQFWDEFWEPRFWVNDNHPPFSFPQPHQSDHYHKFLGAFVDETSIDDDNTTITAWIKSKPINSIVYGAFGSTSIIPYDRMNNLMSGLAMFLLQIETSFLMLAFRSINYETYKAVLTNLTNDQYRQVLENKERVWIEHGFVKQKWILQQTRVKTFLSHCGVGSSLEGLYFEKSILCMPFNMDQFMNGFSIAKLNVGQTLFTRPPLLQAFLSLGDYTKYTFTLDSVTNKLMSMWTNITYEKAVKRISLEMKHAGGVKRAVEEIEFFVKLDGNLDHFVSFQNTLIFYQRSCLDLLLIFVILPMLITGYVVLKCCRRRRKVKTD